MTESKIEIRIQEDPIDVAAEYASVGEPGCVWRIRLCFDTITPPFPQSISRSLAP